ncbi:MAG TPA: hypothetical protein DET67_13375 [Ruegeria sp.]|nr:hypothetical protein [Ruegeria sp.]
MPIREISRRNGLSRNTIGMYLREGAVEPNFKTPSRPSKLDPYAIGPDQPSAVVFSAAPQLHQTGRSSILQHFLRLKVGRVGHCCRSSANTKRLETHFWCICSTAHAAQSHFTKAFTAGRSNVSGSATA